MFCLNCGANNPDDAAVCGSCGAQLTPQEETKPLSFVRPVAGSAAPEAEDAAGASEAFGSTGGDAGTIAVPAAEKGEAEQAAPAEQPKRVAVLFYTLFGIAAAAVILLSILLSGRSAQTTAVRAAEAWFAPSNAQLYKLIPRAVLKADGITRSDYKYAAKTADMNFRIASTELEGTLGADIRYNVRVRNKKSTDREELMELQTLYQEKYGLTVSDAGLVKVRVTATAGADDDTFNLRIPVVKIGRNWYLAGEWTTLDLLDGYESVLEEFDLT